MVMVTDDRMLETQLKNCINDICKPSSTKSISRENRLRIRPNGVVSKNNIVPLETESKSARCALTAPLRMALKQ